LKPKNKDKCQSFVFRKRTSRTSVSNSSDSFGGDEWVAGDDKSPFIVRSASHVDAGGGGDGGRGGAVVSDIKAAGGGAEVPGVVALAGDGESLRETPRARGEQTQARWLGIVREGDTSEGSHRIHAGDRLQGAQKDASGLARVLAADVGAVMIAVDEIDIGVAGRAKEDSIAGGLSAVGVGSGVDGAEVGFGFNDASGEDSMFPTFAKGGFAAGYAATDATPAAGARRMWATRGYRRWAPDEEFAEEIAGDLAGIAGIEGSREGDEGTGSGHRDL
jgi:hypothetical protein